MCRRVHHVLVLLVGCWQRGHLRCPGNVHKIKELGHGLLPPNWFLTRQRHSVTLSQSPLSLHSDSTSPSKFADSC